MDVSNIQIEYTSLLRQRRTLNEGANGYREYELFGFMKYGCEQQG